MAKVVEFGFFGDKIIKAEEMKLSAMSAAVLYGLSVYTVFPLVVNEKKEVSAFCLSDHFERLLNSAKIIGIDTFAKEWDLAKFKTAVKELVKANTITEKVFVRATVHISEEIPGTRSRGLATTLSLFIYEAKPIVPQTGARLKTSVWRRVPDYAIPSRAKVNGAYVNSVLGKQDAIDSGYDDCLFLDINGHVCELSAANIFLVKNNTLITPDRSTDILEGINRKVILELAEEMDLKTVERKIDLTELYTADEVFACGTSSFVAPVIEIDARPIGVAGANYVTQKIRERYLDLFIDSRYLEKVE